MLAFHKVQTGITWGVNNYSPNRFFELIRALPQDIEISFDDGYAHLIHILEKLISLERKPIVFIPTAWIGKRNEWDYAVRVAPERHLDRSEIVELARMGVRFGSHGHTHRAFTELSKQEIERELRASKDILEDIVGSSVTKLSYPFGRSNKSIETLAEEAGYDHGYTMSLPKSRDTQLSLGREPVYSFDTIRSINARLQLGPLEKLERVKCGVIHSLNSGTLLWNRLIGRNWVQRALAVANNPE